jgi:hypothetical protein
MSKTALNFGQVPHPYTYSPSAHRNELRGIARAIACIYIGYCSEMSARSSIITKAIFLYSDFRQSMAAVAAVAIFMRLT